MRPEFRSDRFINLTGLSYRHEKDSEWEFTFHHSIFDQDVNFMFDDLCYTPSVKESLYLLPIREQWDDDAEGGPIPVLYGLIILSVGNGSYARVGTFITNEEGTTSMIEDVELRQRIDIV